MFERMKLLHGGDALYFRIIGTTRNPLFIHAIAKDPKPRITKTGNGEKIRQ